MWELPILELSLQKKSDPLEFYLWPMTRDGESYSSATSGEPDVPTRAKKYAKAKQNHFKHGNSKQFVHLENWPSV